MLNKKLKLLSQLKTDIIELRERIQKLEGEIAVEMCPIKIEDAITINDDGKIYRGIVKEVGTLYSPYDLVNPTVDNVPTWRVRGVRINKGSGEPGKRNFELLGNRAELLNGVWFIKVNLPEFFFNT
jgi:hypothetical protein